MAGRQLTMLALTFGMAACQPPDRQPTAAATLAPTPVPSPTPALLGLHDGPASENHIPLVMRGHWRRNDTTPGATIACAAVDPRRVMHIDRDTIDGADGPALLRSIDRISPDHLRATVEERRGSHAVRHQVTLDVDSGGDRLTLRGKDDGGKAFVYRYQRCSMQQR